MTCWKDYKHESNLKVQEMNSDHSYFDRFKLCAVDHPIGTELGVTENNDLVLYIPGLVYSSDQAKLNGENVTDLIRFDPGSKGVSSGVEDLLNMNFSGAFLIHTLKSLEGATDSTALITDPGTMDFIIDPPKLVAGTVTTGETELSGRTFARRERKSIVIVPVGQGTIPEVVDVRWHRDYAIRWAALTRVFYGGYRSTPLPLLSAVHSSGTDVKNELLNTDRQYAEMDSAEYIELSFGAGGAVPAGFTRSFVLETTGRYVRPSQNVKEAASLSKTGTTEESVEGVPASFELKANYPNPFNPSTTIEYAVPRAGHVDIRVFDALGREIAVLVNETKPVGNYRIRFDASDFPSGVCFYRMKSGSFEKTRKFLLMK